MNYIKNNVRTNNNNNNNNIDKMKNVWEIIIKKLTIKLYYNL